MLKLICIMLRRITDHLLMFWTPACGINLVDLRPMWYNKCKISPLAGAVLLSLALSFGAYRIGKDGYEYIKLFGRIR